MSETSPTPRPRWLDNIQAPFLREERHGVTVDFWSDDAEVKRRLTPDELVDFGTSKKPIAVLQILPDKGLFRAACRLNLDDPCGQYLLWEIRADIRLIEREPDSATAIYFGRIVAEVKRVVAMILGKPRLPEVQWRN